MFKEPWIVIGKMCTVFHILPLKQGVHKKQPRFRFDFGHRYIVRAGSGGGGGGAGGAEGGEGGGGGAGGRGCCSFISIFMHYVSPLTDRNHHRSSIVKISL